MVLPETPAAWVTTLRVLLPWTKAPKAEATALWVSVTATPEMLGTRELGTEAVKDTSRVPTWEAPL